MSTAITNATVKGDKGQRIIPLVTVDPEIFFTVLPTEILSEVGASAESLKARVELGDGGSVEAQIYSVSLSAQDRENVTLVATYENAKPLLGAKFLEDLGLKLDRESGSLEPMRHRGFAYGYEP